MTRKSDLWVHLGLSFLEGGAISATIGMRGSGTAEDQVILDGDDAEAAELLMARVIHRVSAEAVYSQTEIQANLKDQVREMAFGDGCTCDPEVVIRCDDLNRSLVYADVSHDPHCPLAPK